MAKSEQYLTDAGYSDVSQPVFNPELMRVVSDVRTAGVVVDSDPSTNTTPSRNMEVTRGLAFARANTTSHHPNYSRASEKLEVTGTGLISPSEPPNQLPPTRMFVKDIQDTNRARNTIRVPTLNCFPANYTAKTNVDFNVPATNELFNLHSSADEIRDLRTHNYDAILILPKFGKIDIVTSMRACSSVVMSVVMRRKTPKVIGLASNNTLEENPSYTPILPDRANYKLQAVSSEGITVNLKPGPQHNRRHLKHACTVLPRVLFAHGLGWMTEEEKEDGKSAFPNDPLMLQSPPLCEIKKKSTEPLLNHSLLLRILRRLRPPPPSTLLPFSFSGTRAFRKAAAVSLLASHHGEPDSIPGRVTPGFPHAGIVPNDAAGRRVFSGISRFLRAFIPVLLHISITLIGPQERAVMSRLNLFTHSYKCIQLWKRNMIPVQCLLLNRLEVENLTPILPHLQWPLWWYCQVTIKNHVRFPVGSPSIFRLRNVTDVAVGICEFSGDYPVSVNIHHLTSPSSALKTSAVYWFRSTTRCKEREDNFEFLHPSSLSVLIFVCIARRNILEVGLQQGFREIVSNDEWTVRSPRGDGDAKMRMASRRRPVHHLDELAGGQARQLQGNPPPPQHTTSIKPLVCRITTRNDTTASGRKARSTLDLGSNVKVLHQPNFLVLDLRFVDFGSKVRDRIEVPNHQFHRLEMNFHPDLQFSFELEWETVICVDLRSDLGSRFGVQDFEKVMVELGGEGVYEGEYLVDATNLNYRVINRHPALHQLRPCPWPLRARTAYAIEGFIKTCDNALLQRQRRLCARAYAIEGFIKTAYAIEGFIKTCDNALLHPSTSVVARAYAIEGFIKTCDNALLQRQRRLCARAYAIEGFIKTAYAIEGFIKTCDNALLHPSTSVVARAYAIEGFIKTCDNALLQRQRRLCARAYAIEGFIKTAYAIEGFIKTCDNALLHPSTSVVARAYAIEGFIKTYDNALLQRQRDCRRGFRSRFRVRIPRGLTCVPNLSAKWWCSHAGPSQQEQVVKSVKRASSNRQWGGVNTKMISIHGHAYTDRDVMGSLKGGGGVSLDMHVNRANCRGEDLHPFRRRGNEVNSVGIKPVATGLGRNERLARRIPIKATLARSLAGSLQSIRMYEIWRTQPLASVGAIRNIQHFDAPQVGWVPDSREQPEAQARKELKEAKPGERSGAEKMKKQVETTRWVEDGFRRQIAAGGGGGPEAKEQYGR
ncbi:hypothetical protein PR048_019097 [Dryococelus australis]|uniref:Uncharacterized protein n=1 Tax=Dryococelus australis TaxID=614101 RepID=A0ABQ9H2I6_9NEOP|nr:hypothetical protein PR048_019097 [Dryococelus australis]